ncbi:hypothetical protein SSCG_01811 [Streptomyces clavuligerus]|nr:hypothetical protein SSCG_01811 [Streptomyces clavuligerus]
MHQGHDTSRHKNLQTMAKRQREAVPDRPRRGSRGRKRLPSTKGRQQEEEQEGERGDGGPVVPVRAVTTAW